MSDTLRGAFWMLGTLVAFSVMAVSGRELAGDLNTFEIMFYRSAIGLLIVLFFVILQNRWRELQTPHFKIHVIRNFTHFTGQNLWFYAVGVIPLAQVFALEFTSPLWVILLSPLILGERLTRTKVFCALIGFAGILIVTRPGGVPLNLGMATAASAAIFFALTIMLTKRLTRTDSVTCILFYLTSIQLVFGLIATGYDGKIPWPTSADWPFVIAVAVGGLVAHFCFTKALSLAPATLMSPIEFGRLPAIAVVALIVYGEPIDIYVLLGATLIFAGNYLNIWSETRRKPKPA